MFRPKSGSIVIQHESGQNCKVLLIEWDDSRGLKNLVVGAKMVCQFHVCRTHMSKACQTDN